MSRITASISYVIRASFVGIFCSSKRQNPYAENMEYQFLKAMYLSVVS